MQINTPTTGPVTCRELLDAMELQKNRRARNDPWLWTLILCNLLDAILSEQRNKRTETFETIIYGIIKYHAHMDMARLLVGNSV